jgi:hypothetical protein
LQDNRIAARRSMIVKWKIILLAACLLSVALGQKTQ